jgi:hypothetical protein
MLFVVNDHTLFISLLEILTNVNLELIFLKNKLLFIFMLLSVNKSLFIK